MIMINTVPGGAARWPRCRRVHAHQAAESGLEFFRANDETWLAVNVPPDFVQRISL